MVIANTHYFFVLKPVFCKKSKSDFWKSVCIWFHSSMCVFSQEAAQWGGRTAPCTASSVCLQWLLRYEKEPGLRCDTHTHTDTDRERYLRCDDHTIMSVMKPSTHRLRLKPCSTCLLYLICKCWSTTFYMFFFGLAKVTCTFALYRICWCLIIKVVCFGFNNPVEENVYIRMFVFIIFWEDLHPKTFFSYLKIFKLLIEPHTKY